MLVLFDIDGTLVSVGGAGRRALSDAIEEVTGAANALDGVRLHGSTDPVILEEAFRAHVGRPLEGESESARILDRYVERLGVALRSSLVDYTVLPSAKTLLEALSATGRHVLGLATGNIERAAKLKLEPGGLASFFHFGGYGSDAGPRADLVRKGIERGQAIADRTFGRPFRREEIVVIGDTERDVTAAHAAGAVAVGVRAGSSFPEVLADAQPELLVDDLGASELWGFLGL